MPVNEIEVNNYGTTHHPFETCKISGTCFFCRTLSVPE